MLVAAYFHSVRTRRLPPLGFGARLGLATSALVVLVCIVQGWILAQRGLDHVRRQLIETARSAPGPAAPHLHHRHPLRRTLHPDRRPRHGPAHPRHHPTTHGPRLRG